MKKEWNTLDFSLTSALLHLMHLPTINHIEISFIPLASNLSLHLTICIGWIYPICSTQRERLVPSQDEQNTVECRVDWKTLFISWLSLHYGGTSFPQCTHLKGPFGLTVRYRSSVCSGFARNWKWWRGHNILETLFFEVKVSRPWDRGFHRIRIPKSGGDTGQTWVVCLETGLFQKSLVRMGWAGRKLRR